MPSTLQYRPTLIDNLISNDRINSYISVFNTVSDMELVGVYLWNSHVCSAIYPVIGAAEIALRNSIDQSLLSHIGQFWWRGSNLRYKSFVPGGPVPFAVNAVKNNFSAATESFKKERYKRYSIPLSVTPTHGGIIAKTDFSTWQFILDDEFMGNRCIWPSRLGSVFKGRWPSTQASTTLGYARDLVSTIRDFRNRLFHHEPAWKRFGVSTESDAIQHLREKIGKIESLISLVHPEKLKMLKKNGVIDSAYRACSSSEIRRFQHMAKVYKVKSISRMIEIADFAVERNSQIIIKTYYGRKRRFMISPV